MSNYLTRIAARSVVPDLPMLMPVDAPVDREALDDPFDGVFVAASETGNVGEEIPGAVKITGVDNATIPEPVHPVKESAIDTPATQQPVEIKPVYLSKYIERNHYYSRDLTHPVNTEIRGNLVVNLGVEQSLAPNVQEDKDRAANNEVADPVTISEKLTPVQLKPPIADEATSKQNGIVSIRPAIEERTSAIVPIAVTLQHDYKPVLLQPDLPSQPEPNFQKQKPAPTLVIGKLTVEIVPAQKPFNQIINQAIKPQPSAQTSTQRNKFSFGLDQL